MPASFYQNDEFVTIFDKGSKEGDIHHLAYIPVLKVALGPIFDHVESGAFKGYPVFLRGECKRLEI